MPESTGKWRLRDKIIAAGILLAEALGAAFGRKATSTGSKEEKDLSHLEESEMVGESERDKELRSLPSQFPKTPGWHDAKPDTIPAPTFTPAVMAFGITFAALGLITKWYVSVVGLAVLAISVWRWFGELRDDG